MAVRSEVVFPAKMVSEAEKNDKGIVATPDHVRRILSDHDYLKHPAAKEDVNEKTSIVNDGLQLENVQLQSGFQEQYGARSSTKRKDEVALPNQGIEACDSGSLLDKFEEAIASLVPSVLTPATSPGRSENWNEQLSLKINSKMNMTDLTPPSTPPIQEKVEKSQIPAITCKSSAKQSKETRKIPAKKSFVRNTATQGKDLKHAVIKKNAKTSSVFLKKVQQENAKEGVAEPAKLHSKLTKGRNVSKMKERGTIADPIPKKKVKKQPESKFESDVQLSKACQKGEQVVPKIEDNKAHQNAWVLVEDTSDKDTNMIESKDNISDKSLHNDNNLNGCSQGESKTSENFSNDDIVMDEKFQKVSNNEYQNEQSGQMINSTDIKNDSNGDMFMEEKLSKVNVCGLEESLSHKNDLDAGADVNGKRDRHIYKLCNNNNDVDMKGTDLCKSANDDGKKIQNRERTAGDGHRSRHRASEDSSKRRSRRYSNDYKNDRRKRKYRSRSPSIEDYSSDERSSNPHRPERFRDSRRHSRDSRNENYRKYSSRDNGVEEDWSHGERDDDGFRNRWKYFRDVEHERKIDFRLGRSNTRDSAKGERRVIYVGGLPYGTTRDELWRRFRKFGPIEKVTVHLRRGERDNYGFVTFLEPDDAKQCMERGNSDPSEPQFDLCFGGRRQFCGGSYVDFDSTTSQIEEISETYGKVCDDVPEEDDFDSLLRMYQNEHRR